VSDGPPPATTRIIGKAITWLVARFPRSWTLLRAPTRRFFDRLAPEWHKRIGAPDRMAPLEAALELAGSRPERILDLGTGTGAAALWLAGRYPEAEVTGVDVAEGMVRLAREDAGQGAGERVRFEVADASALGFDDGAFDLVVQVSAPAFFAETARVLAPGGHLIVVSSRGTGTPFHTPVALLRRGFEREGLRWVGEGAAGPGTYYVLHKGPAT
jgi:SAM-dependent methyltransferase